MTLVDTSSWIEALRQHGDPAVRARVARLLEQGEAAWCQIVRLELWRGANNDWDRQLLRHMEATLKMLAMSDEVWERAIGLSQKMRSEGLTVPLPDLLVFACASVHGVEIEHNDKHFALMAAKYPPSMQA